MSPYLALGKGTQRRVLSISDWVLCPCLASGIQETLRTRVVQVQRGEARWAHVALPRPPGFWARESRPAQA